MDKRIVSFLKQNWSYILAITVMVVLISLTLTLEGFSDLAEYPKVFMEGVAKPFVGDVYSSVFEPQPLMPAISQLNIESQIKTVMIDIGNGTAVEAPVHIPAQIIENIQEQRVIKYVEPKETDVIVASQVIQLPEQQGVISTEVNAEGDYIQVPVVVPAQTVTIPEQTAKETLVEKFHI
jgi:hypothetical protein